MSIRAVIFDLFGTLIDFLPEEDYRRTHEDIAALLSVSADDFRQCWYGCTHERDTGQFGGVEGTIRHICRSLMGEPAPELLQAFLDIRLGIIRRNLAPRNGAIELLTQLQENGIRIGLISDCSDDIPHIWHETPFAPLIEAPLFSCIEQLKKPDSRLYQRVCERLAVAPEECLYVGDGMSRELTGALRAGMRPVLINVGYESELDLYREDALEWTGPVIRDLRGVLEHIEIR